SAPGSTPRRLRICIEEFDCSYRVILLGSVARRDYRVDSDIDVLVITELAEDTWKRAEIALRIRERLGFGDPLELHISDAEDLRRVVQEADRRLRGVLTNRLQRASRRPPTSQGAPEPVEGGRLFRRRRTETNGPPPAGLRRIARTP
ncbi:MAG: nucleotidyltransferase domain-containing protein, partial [Pyrobaculum sp.]